MVSSDNFLPYGSKNSLDLPGTITVLGHLDENDAKEYWEVKLPNKYGNSLRRKVWLPPNLMMFILYVEGVCF